MKTRFIRHTLFLGGILAIFASSIPAVYSQQSTSPKSGVVGSFKVGGWDRALLKNRKQGIAAVLTGKNGGVVQATSNLYDIAAKRLEIMMTSVNGKNKPSEMSAIGSVKIVIRDADPSRKTVVTCDKAQFEAAASATERGTLKLTGNVVSDTWDKSLVAPLHSESETGRIVFLPDGELDMQLDNGVFTGQPIEPPAKPKGKQP